jgi:uncharacterized coiled-coil protein SlyX
MPDQFTMGWQRPLHPIGHVVRKLSRLENQMTNQQSVNNELTDTVIHAQHAVKDLADLLRNVSSAGPAFRETLAAGRTLEWVAHWVACVKYPVDQERFPF